MVGSASPYQAKRVLAASWQAMPGLRSGRFCIACPNPRLSAPQLPNLR